MIAFAVHFTPFGKQGNNDAYWLAVWSACSAGTAAVNLWVALVMLSPIGY
jgi:hypothetical protein